MTKKHFSGEKLSISDVFKQMMLKNRVMKKMKNRTLKQSKEEDMHKMLAAVVLQMQVYEKQLEELLGQKLQLEETVRSLESRSLFASSKLQHVLEANSTAATAVQGLLDSMEAPPIGGLGSGENHPPAQHLKEKLQEVVSVLKSKPVHAAGPGKNSSPIGNLADHKPKKLRDIFKLATKAEVPAPNKDKTKSDLSIAILPADSPAQQSPRPKTADQAKSTPVSQKAKRNRIHLFVISSDEEDAKTAARRTPISSKKQYRDAWPLQPNVRQDCLGLGVPAISREGCSSPNTVNRLKAQTSLSGNLQLARRGKAPKKSVTFEESIDDFMSPPAELESKAQLFDFCEPNHEQVQVESNHAEESRERRKFSRTGLGGWDQDQQEDRPPPVLQFRTKRIIVHKDPDEFQRAPLKTSIRSASMVDQQSPGLDGGGPPGTSQDRHTSSKGRLPSSHKIIPLHQHPDRPAKAPGSGTPTISISKTFRKLISRVLEPFAPPKPENPAAVGGQEFPWV